MLLGGGGGAGLGEMDVRVLEGRRVCSDGSLDGWRAGRASRRSGDELLMELVGEEEDDGISCCIVWDEIM